jgi:hypothetical protein
MIAGSCSAIVHGRASPMSWLTGVGYSVNETPKSPLARFCMYRTNCSHSGLSRPNSAVYAS